MRNHTIDTGQPGMHLVHSNGRRQRDGADPLQKATNVLMRHRRDPAFGMTGLSVCIA